MTGRDDLLQHLAGGVTQVCRCWLVTRRDGVQLGFTDHDMALQFDGHEFRAASGLTAGAVQQTTGLSVDNGEALGALSDAAITEADLAAGLFDGAEVTCWLVNWADVSQRMTEFRGNFGEVIRKGGAFRVELRGLTERLNRLQGAIYQAGCAAVLGDARCGIDLDLPAHQITAEIVGVDAMGRLTIAGATAYADHWFERGQIEVLSGESAGARVMIRQDRLTDDGRVIELWHGTGRALAPGDSLRLRVGCDRKAKTCQDKFQNFLNFRGFPHVPGEDWLASYPVSSKMNDGGSLQG